MIQLIKSSGDVKEVCQSIASLAERFKGWTVETLLRYATIVEAERLQFGGADNVHR